MNFREKTHLFFEIARPEDKASYWFDIFMIVLILSNVIAIILETVQAINLVLGPFFYWFELFSVVIFTVEYIMRVWSCVDDPTGQYRHTVIGRFKYMLSPIAVIDLVAFLPFYLTAFFGVDLRILRLVRLLRLMKLTRYSPALSIIGAVVMSQHRALTAALLVMLMALLFSSSIMYALENEVQPDKFSSIPQAMWWGMASLTTVGYGDVAPITPWGQFFGIITMVIGIGMFALPTGVIATGFANEIRKLDFVANSKLVSTVPLFKELDANGISEIVSLLTPKTVPQNYAVLKVGEKSEGMFFIVSGQVEVELTTKTIVLKEKSFFGEMGILDDSPRTATVVTLTECELLELKAEDFHHLMDTHASIRETMDEVIKERRKTLENDFVKD